MRPPELPVHAGLLGVDPTTFGPVLPSDLPPAAEYPEDPHAWIAPLTETERAVWEDMLAGGPLDQKLLEHASGIDITRKHVQCMRVKEWLNDEVINVFMAMMQVGLPAWLPEQPSCQSSCLCSHLVI